MNKESGQPTEAKEKVMFKPGGASKESDQKESDQKSIQPTPESSKSVINDYNKDDGEYKINVIKDYHGGLDLTHLNKKDPNFQYRWLNKDKANLAKKTHNILSAMGGWQLCGRTHLKKRLEIADADIAADGLYYRGSDLVLSFMPKDLYAEKKAMKQTRANEPLEVIAGKKKGVDFGSNKEGDTAIKVKVEVE